MYSVRIAKYPKGFPFTQAYKSVCSVIYFEPVGADKTRVSIRMLAIPTTKNRKKMREFFVRGNQHTLDQLAAKYRPAK